MQANRQGLCQGRLGQAQVVRNGMRLAGINDQFFAECALDVGKRHGAAVKTHKQAVVVLPSLAKLATPAGPGRGNGDALADLQAVDLAAHSLNNTRNLMAQGHRLLDAHRAKTAMLVVMQVRAANAAKSHLHQQLLLSQTRRLNVLQPQIFGRMANQGTHGWSSQSVAVKPPSTYKIWPLTNLEASLAKNTTAPPRSSTSPQRRLGVRPTSQLVNCGSAANFSVSSVLK